MVSKLQHRIVLAVAAGLALTTFTADIARLLPLPSLFDHIPYARSGLSYVLDISGMFLLLLLVGGVTGREQWTFLGLGRDWRPAALMGFLLFSPLILTGLAMGRLAEDSELSSLFFLSLLAPFAEEVVYRGLAVGALMTIAGWRFWPAALFPAAVFGLAHLAQGDGPMDTAMVVAITAVGGLFFGWLYHRFGRNLWPAIVMHVGMNLVWNLFDFGENAVGDGLGNVLRAISVLGAIAFALWGQQWLQRVTGSHQHD